MRNRLYSLAAICCVGALALSGCSKGGGQSGGDQSGEGKKGAAEEYVPGPLEKYMSALYGGEEFNEESFAKQNKQMEEAIATCMADQGFEYFPVEGDVGLATSSDMDQDPTGPEWGSLEFAEKYGYGFVSYPGMDEVPETEEPVMDKNQAYMDSLTPSERAAYQEALYGTQAASDTVVMDENYSEEDLPEYDWTKAGCQGKASHDVMEDIPGAKVWEDPQFTDLMDAANAIYEDVEKDPAAKKLEASWTSCMSDAGFPGIASKQDASNSLLEEYNELTTDSKGEFTEMSKEARDAFQAKEIKQAVADWKCADKVKYDKTMQEIQFAAEEKFIQEHKAELDALLAKYAPAGS